MKVPSITWKIRKNAMWYYGTPPALSPPLAITDWPVEPERLLHQIRSTGAKRAEATP